MLICQRVIFSLMMPHESMFFFVCVAWLPSKNGITWRFFTIQLRSSLYNDLKLFTDFWICLVYPPNLPFGETYILINKNPLQVVAPHFQTNLDMAALPHC
jgi:hypothetical protein